MNFLSKNLQYLRKKKGVSQVEMPKYIGTTRSTWANYESNASEPDISKLFEIAKLFNVTLDELILKDLSYDPDLNDQLNLDKSHPENTRTENNSLLNQSPLNLNLTEDILNKLESIAKDVSIIKNKLL